MTTIRRWKQGATLPSIADQLLDVAGDPIDLSTASVAFVMGPAAGGTFLNAAGTITSGTAGSVQYDWGASDLATAGLYHAYWEVTYADNSVEKFPQGGTVPGEPDFILVKVTDDVG